MVSVPKSASPDDNQSASKKINEIYDKLIQGENFETLVKNYSDDPSSNNKGGVLPVFGTGSTTRMVTEFEDAAFKLEKNGDISKPIRTNYGYHIIKRLEWYDVPTFDASKKEIQAKVNKDERSLKTQESFVSNLKKEYGFKDKSKKSLKWFVANIDSNFAKGEWSASKLKSDKTIFIIDGKKFGQKEFAKYAEQNQKSPKNITNDILVGNLYKRWEKEAILSYEETKLPQKHSEFKALLNEYHDGIILYEIMSDKVWNKAMRDTVGLKAYFEANRSKYTWIKRVDAMVYECSNKQIADEVFKMIQNDTINSKHVIDKINKDSELNLRVKTNKYEIANTSFLKGKNWEKGVNKPYELDGKIYVIKVAEVLEPGLKELSEAKGAITSDYQNYLEKTWLEELSKKYPIKLNLEVLYSLGK